MVNKHLNVKYFAVFGLATLILVSYFILTFNRANALSDVDINSQLIDSFWMSDSLQFASQLEQFQNVSKIKNSVVSSNIAIWYSHLGGFEIERILDSTMKVNELNRCYFTTSLDHLQNAYDLNENDPMYCHNLAWIYLFLGDTARSFVFFNKSITLNSVETVYSISMGIFQELISVPQNSIIYYTKAIQNSPSILNSPFFEDLKCRLPNVASMALQSALNNLESDVSDITKLSRLGKIYYHLGNDSLAQSIYKKVTLILPNLNRPWYILGEIEESYGNLKKADNLYYKSMLLDSQDYLPLFKLADFALKQGREKEALRYFITGLRCYLRMSSHHFKHGIDIYKGVRGISNDILPKGLLEYTRPRVDIKSISNKVSQLYLKNNDMEKSNIYKRISEGSIDLNECLFHKMYN